jgi:CDGSH-type Zn-finger protein
MRTRTPNACAKHTRTPKPPFCFSSRLHPHHLAPKHPFNNKTQQQQSPKHPPPKKKQNTTTTNLKVVDTVKTEDLGKKAVFCRCWRSGKFPLCDGAHAKHNAETGDNVGPLIIEKPQ